MWPGRRALDAVPALADALAGRRSLLPVPADDPARADLLARSQAAGEPIAADVAIVACTSGSTGTPKGAMLTAANLCTSIDATHARLGGPGQWLLATPPAHIAGLQVLLRTIRAGEVPAAMELDDGFRPGAMADAIAAMTGRRRYTSVVPLQLRRILDNPAATEALASLDGVLVGGQATAPELLDRARAAGIVAVTSYGSSETSGGIAYDGVPLDGAEVSVEEDSGRIVITGPMVSCGYRNVDSPDLRPALAPRTPQRSDDVHGAFRTSDAGRITFSPGTGSPDTGSPDSGARNTGSPDTGSSGDSGDSGPAGTGRLTVLGRIDDVIVSGGLKFLPGPIENALTALDGIADAAVVGIPHPELGHAVVAAVTLAGDLLSQPPTTDHAISEHLRARLAPALAKHQVPRAVFVVKQLPTLPSGKLDRTYLAEHLSARWEMMSQ